MLLDAPPEWIRAGSFSGSNGHYLEARLFGAYIKRLKAVSVTHDLDRRFMKNYGSAAEPYAFRNVPRMVVMGAERLELLVEAYDAASDDYGNGMINIYSIAPESARQVFGKIFTSAEFGEPTPLVTKVNFSEGVPAEEVAFPIKISNN